MPIFASRLWCRLKELKAQRRLVVPVVLHVKGRTDGPNEPSLSPLKQQNRLKAARWSLFTAHRNQQSRLWPSNTHAASVSKRFSCAPLLPLRPWSKVHFPPVGQSSSDSELAKVHARGAGSEKLLQGPALDKHHTLIPSFCYARGRAMDTRARPRL